MEGLAAVNRIRDGASATAAKNGVYMEGLAAVNRIRARMVRLGKTAEIDLPQAVIAGDQSSGKSSLLEAYSGVLLPFGSGTCTRCPTEIDMHPNESNSHTDRTFKVQDKAVERDELIGEITEAQKQILLE